MAKFLTDALKVAVVAALLLVAVGGQTPPKAESFVGEKLEFEGKLSKIIQGMAVADLTFSFERDATGKNFLVRSSANSKGSLIKLFRFSFLQQYETTIDALTLNVLKTAKHDVQRDRVRDSVADFDYKDKRVVFVENDPKAPTRPPRRIASTIEDTMNDIVSGIYRLRTMPLAVGKNLRMDVSDTGLTYPVPVRITAREQQKTIFGKVMCLRIEPDVFGPGRLIEQEGKMVIWIVDDATRIPVRSIIDTPYGKFDVRLKKITKA